FFSSRRRHTRFSRDWSSDVCSSDLLLDEPVIFDCIEFNDEYRHVDVLNEVAFLCMDLDVFGRSDLSRTFMEDYSLQFSAISGTRSEERRVGKECRSRGAPGREKQKA